MIHRIIAASEGSSYSIFLDDKGQVFSFYDKERVFSYGGNTSGQLEDPTSLNKTGIRQVESIEGRVIAVAAGGNQCLALTEQGKVFDWVPLGYKKFPNFEWAISEKVIEIGAGMEHCVALTESGAVLVWGSNNGQGQLGRGAESSNSRLVQIFGIEGRVVKISVGRYHSLALTEEGEVWGWGRNEEYQLGLVRHYKGVPFRIEGLKQRAIGIAAGGWHSMALTEDGEIWSWGNNSKGQLGDGTYLGDEKYSGLSFNRAIPLNRVQGFKGMKVEKNCGGGLSFFGACWRRDG